MKGEVQADEAPIQAVHRCQRIAVPPRLGRLIAGPRSANRNGWWQVVPSIRRALKPVVGRG